jgi:hypothetical protein
MKDPHIQQTSLIDASPKSAPNKILRATKDLSPGEKKTAMAILRQRQRHGKLDPKWARDFMKVLTAIKAQEQR